MKGLDDKHLKKKGKVATKQHKTEEPEYEPSNNTQQGAF